MNFPKKQAQRLIPEYLLDYTTKLQNSHPDPTESWGGGSGGSYTGGDGIDITNNVISVDNTIAKKSEIPTKTSELTNDSGFITSTALNDYVTTTQLDGKLTDYALNTDIPTKVSQLTNDSGYTTQTWVETQGYSKFSGSYNDLTDKPDLSIYAQSSNLSTVATTGSYNDLIDKPTLATVATSGSYNDLNERPVFATVATSGSYKDLKDTNNVLMSDRPQSITTTKSFDQGTLAVSYQGYSLFFYTDKVYRSNGISSTYFKLPITTKESGTPESPTEYTLATTDDIPNSDNFVTLDTAQTISGAKTFNGGLITENTTFGMKMNIIPAGRFDYTYNNQGTIESTLFDLPTGKTPGTEQQPTTYTIATTDDIHNPTITFTQGGTTKGTITLNQSGDQTIEFDAGGGGGGSATNMVTTDTNQEITGEKTFVGTKRIKFKQHYQDDKLGFTGFDANGTQIGYLEMSKSDRDFTGSPTSNILGYWSSKSAPNPSSDGMLGFKYFTKDSDGNFRNYKLVVPPRYNEVGATRYIPISVNGTTADNTGNINVPTETLVFTLADNSTVTVNVMTSATASTTTTS